MAKIELTQEELSTLFEKIDARASHEDPISSRFVADRRTNHNIKGESDIGIERFTRIGTGNPDDPTYARETNERAILSDNESTRCIMIVKDSNGNFSHIGP